MVIKNMREELDRLRKIDDRTIDLKNKLKAIDLYDRTVQAVISENPLLKEAWDNFAVSYQLIAETKICTRARDKILEKENGPRCKSCNQLIDSEYGRWNP